MNTITKVKVAKRQGWVMRLITAVTDKFFNWVCSIEVSPNTFTGQEFLYYGGYGWEEARQYQPLVYLKMKQKAPNSNQ